MAAGRAVGGALQLFLLSVFIYRSPQLGHRVWGRRLPWSVVKSRVLNASAIYDFFALALPSAIIWWIEWFVHPLGEHLIGVTEKCSLTCVGGHSKA